METAGASRPLNGIHDRELEVAREPPEQISGKSLGQVAEVLPATARKGYHFSSCGASQGDQGGAEGTTRMATRDSVNVTSLNGPTMGSSTTTAQEYTTSGPHRQVPCSQESRSPSPDRTPFCLGLPSEDRSELSTPLLTKWLGAATTILLRFALLTLAYIAPLTIAALGIALKNGASVLLSWFHALLLFTIRKFLVILLGGLIRIWASCVHRRPTSTPVHSNFDKGPSDDRIPDTLVPPHTPDPAPSIKRLQCECCLSDYPASSIVHCPGMHSVCVDCLSSYVAEQAPHLADASVAEVVCSHSSGCGRAFDAAVLQVLPEAVLRQLLDLVSLPISRQLEGRRADTELLLVRIRRVERDGGDEDTLCSDGGRSPASPTARLEDAMSRCTESLQNHGVQTESPDASPPHPLRRSDADSDVNDYARSLSAFIHLRREQDCGPAHAEPPTPMRPPLAMIATTPQTRRDFATAPPLDPPGPPSALNQHAASAQSAFQLQVDDPNFQDPYAILERMRKNRDNAQARLRNAKKAFDRDECERTRRKVELETRRREEARERVAEAERAVEGYEKERLSLSLTP